VKNALRVALWVPLLVATTARNAASQNLQPGASDIVARSAPAVVTIKTFDEAGQAIGLGSGFRVSSGRVVTNAHVVAGASRVEVFDNNEQLLGTATFAEAVSTTVDLAILPRLGVRTAQLAIAPTLPPVGDRVVVIGAPEGLSNTVSDGLVSAVRSIDGRTLLQISAPISPGSSGGPVLNTRGEVVGVSVSMLREGQNLNFAVPLNDLVAMLGSPVGHVAFPPRTTERTANTSRSIASHHLTQVHVGESVDGSLTADDRTLSNGTRFDQYLLQLASGTRVTVSLHSRDFDAYLLVLQVDADTLVAVASDDDSGGGLDAEANFVAPATASYVISVFSASKRSQSGDYRLTVENGVQSAQTGISSPESSDSERWVRSARGEGISWSYDRTRIQPMGNGIYRIWTRWDLDTPKRNTKGDSYDKSLSLDDVDCSRSRARVLQLIEYNRGKVVYSSDWDGPSEWNVLVPESVGEIHYQALCRYVTARGL
jgi:trypsin-like peptidase/surface-adhesin protein E